MFPKSNDKCKRDNQSVLKTYRFSSIHEHLSKIFQLKFHLKVE